MGTLYLVSTPIGNLEDITVRALAVLRSARLIAAEDTRQTQKLLRKYQITTPTISYHEHNKLAREDRIVQALAEGDVALVSDAGTPGLNDPGYELVQAVLRAGLPVSPIPGPSAPVAALVTSGLPTDAFTYLGYLPRKASERRARLAEIAALPYTLIFLETPHRLIDALDDLLAVLGNRRIAVARELTKLHEEIFRGTINEARERFQRDVPRGEFTLVVEGHTAAASGPWQETQIEDALREGLASGLPIAKLAALLSEQSGVSRREIYQKALLLRGDAGPARTERMETD